MNTWTIRCGDTAYMVPADDPWEAMRLVAGSLSWEGPVTVRRSDDGAGYEIRSMEDVRMETERVMDEIEQRLARLADEMREMNERDRQRHQRLMEALDQAIRQAQKTLRIVEGITG